MGLEPHRDAVAIRVNFRKMAGAIESNRASRLNSFRAEVI